MEAVVPDVEELAKELHRRLCQRKGIYDDSKIAEYWLGCDRKMYRQKAAVVESAVEIEKKRMAGTL